MKYIPNAMKIGSQSWSSSLIINMISEIADLDLELKTWANVVSKLQCARFLWNFALRTNRTCWLWIYQLELMTLTQNYRFANFGRKTEMCFNFYDIWRLEQIKHVNYEYSTWNWWNWPKVIDPGNFSSKIEMCSNLLEIWHSRHF